MDYANLRLINVNEKTEKKGNLTYLSWTYAVDELLQKDPMATWEFPEPKLYGDTMMVFCNVTAFGKTMKMHLPVMDNRNNALKNPDARKISDSMMRALAKCIACFGIGLYIYAGSDLPDVDTDTGEVHKTKVDVNEDNSWRITVDKQQPTWMKEVENATILLLKMASSVEDLEQLYKININLYTAIKSNNKIIYDSILTSFNITKELLKKGKENG
jgi:hypothetical protein